MKLIYFIIAIVAFYLAYGFMISQIDFNADITSTTSLTIENKKKYNDYKGVINVHSNLGEGKGTIPEIVQAAYQAKLDFIIFTESNIYSKKLEPPTYSGDLLVLHGREYSYLKSKLILLNENFDAQEITNAANAHLYISDVLERPNNDTFIILNHPSKPGYTWQGEYSPNIDALEIINLRSNWSEAWNKSKFNFLRSLLIYPFNADYAFLNLFQPPRANLKIWYRLNNTHPKVGLLGTDAKSKLRVFKDTYLKFPSYKKIFSLGSNHILIKSELTGNVTTDSKKVLDAIKMGSLYLSLDFVGNPLGFQFYGQARKQTFSMGQEIHKDNSEICLEFPPHAERSRAVVYRNGEKYLETNKDLCFKADQVGVYNTIIYKKLKRVWPMRSFNIPWIFSNPIFVSETQKK